MTRISVREREIELPRGRWQTTRTEDPKMKNEKKAYVAPRVTVHGNAVEMTQGYGGRLLELIDWRPR
jgi:hypothetical protein